MTTMTADELELAENCYGYGLWNARYWFIGPEQGQGEKEDNSLTDRAKAFRKLELDGLCDCRKYHEEIGVCDWHVPNRKTGKVKLQSTWKSLILTLKILLDKPEETDTDSRRSYQRFKWGSSSGETCVIELSGLPARSLGIIRDRERFRQLRIETIDKKMRAAKPRFVVIYGKTQAQHWRAFWAKMNSPTIFLSEQIVRIGSTIIGFAPSPTARGPGNKLWRELGQQLVRASAP